MKEKIKKLTEAEKTIRIDYCMGTMEQGVSQMIWHISVLQKCPHCRHTEEEVIAYDPDIETALDEALEYLKNK